MYSFFEWTQLLALVAFLTLFIGRSVQLGVLHRVRVFTVLISKGGAEAVRELLFLVAFPLWIYLVAATAGPLGLPALPTRVDPVLIRGLGFDLAGAILLMSSVLLFAWSLLSFGRSWRVGIDHSGSGGLITRGAFGWSRNPIFLSMDGMVVGAFLVAGRISLLAFAVALVLGLHKQIREEERFLSGCHGAIYDDYRAAVARYLGRHAAPSWATVAGPAGPSSPDPE